jgi:WD40 repeat protein/serine/threonine protein kinase
MNICHACHHELDEAALAARRCAHCGAIVRPIAKRTIEDKRSPFGGPALESSESDSGEDLRLVGTGSDPERKSPTVPDRSDLTIDFTAPIEPDGQHPDSPSDSGDRPTRRSTQTLERDMTVDFDASSADAQQIDSQWKGTFEHGARTGQTIRQRETIGGFRSSLPVKSRHVRERKKDGGTPPTTLAEVPDYELLEIIGEGGMGVVYAAHQSSIARTVAVKMLKPSPKIRDEQRDKFISEAVVTGELDHPNIVPIYDLGANDEGALFYSMKRVRGTPWDKVLNQKQIEENLSILLRVADAVAFAHAGGVIHRDLKPENVMLGDFGEVLVMDWGLARITSSFANISSVYQADNLGGTPAYMAPEMARGPVEKINMTSDIYLLGAILYEIVGGRPPHSGRDVMQCLMSASQNRIDPIRYDGELKNIALKAMATEQKDRYQTVKEFQEAIRTYQSHSESLVLTAHANQNLQRARESNDYALYARALYGCQESLTLWSENHRARTLLAETQRDYARCAFDKGDLDLAASLLDTSHADQQELLSQIDVARAERDARQRRLRRAKQAVAAMIAAVIAVVTVAYFSVRSQRNRAVEAEKVAVKERVIAEDAKKEEEKAKVEAVGQRNVAREAQKDAEVQRNQAIAARAEEEAAKKLAQAEEQRAIAAKKEEEYQAYVARIGLAAAKINDNAFDFADRLLEQCVPTAADQVDLRNWEWGRLKHLTKLSTEAFQATGPVDAVAFSPDGDSVASADRDGKLAVRDAKTGELRFPVIPHGQYVSSVAYSPDGKLLASGSSDRTIRILDAATGQLRATLSGPNGHTNGVLCVRFSPDGRYLASGAYDNTVRIWDLNTAGAAASAPVQTLVGHTWWVWAAEFSPDGKQLVTAGQDGKAIVWARPEGRQRGQGSANRLPAPGLQSAAPSSQPLFEQITEFDGHDGAVYAAAFSPDGKRVATGGYDKLVLVWDPDTVRPIDVQRRLDEVEDAPKNYVTLSGHDGPVRSVTFSPKGDHIASGSEDNAIRIWDVARAESVQMLRGHSQAVRSVVFSPHGGWIASGSHDASIRLWDLAGYQEVRVLHSTVFRGHADAVMSARFSQDGKQIVTASRDRTAMLWDAKSGKRLQQFQEGHDFLATSAAFFDGGRRLATAAGDNTVRIWDVAAGTESKREMTPTGRIGALAVSPGGDWLVSGTPGTALRIWNVQTREPIATLEGHKAEVSALAISPEGDLIASGDDRGRVRLWRQNGAGVWEFSRELTGHSQSITGVRFSPDGRRLVTASGDRTCGQWDVASGQEIRSLVLKHPKWVSSLDLSADGTMAATTCDDGKARLWRLADAKEILSVTSPDAPFNSVGLSPDSRRAVLVSSSDTIRKVRLWDMRGQVVAGQAAAPQVNAAMKTASDAQTAPADPSLQLLLDFEKLGGLIWSAMFSPDGSQLVTIGGNDVQLWNLDTLRPVVRLSPHGTVASSDLSRDSRLVVTASWDRSAKIWDASTGQAIRKLDGGHAGPINYVQFSADGRDVLTASDDGTARQWEVATGKPSDVVYRGHTGRVFSAVYSPDGGRILTASGDKTARIWDRASGRQLRSLEGRDGHAWGVLCGQFSPDGQRVLTGGEDNMAILWDVQTGERLFTLGGHTAAVTSVAFSPDGTRVLTGSRDNSAKLWDAFTGKEILSMPGHTQEVTSVSFSSDGHNVLTSSRDGTAIIWLAENWR